MGFQFIREECYAKVRSQGAPTGKKGNARRQRGKISAREAIAEACRLPNASPHVAEPLLPRCLAGLQADELPIWLEQLEDCARAVMVKSSRGMRRQRSDTPILIGTVASYPAKANDNDPLYVQWREKTLAFLTARYGTKLISVLEHTDEPYGHVHAFVSDAGRTVKPFHAGHAASLLAAGSGAPKKAQSEAYKGGVRKLQDDFFLQVGSQTGLARIGPRKLRKTRLEWQAQKTNNRVVALALLKGEEERERVYKRVQEAEAFLQEAEFARKQIEKTEEAAKKQRSIENACLFARWEKILLLESSIKDKERQLIAALSNVNVKELIDRNAHLQQCVNVLSSAAISGQEPSNPLSDTLAQASAISRKL